MRAIFFMLPVMFDAFLILCFFAGLIWIALNMIHFFLSNQFEFDFDEQPKQEVKFDLFYLSHKVKSFLTRKEK